MAYALGVDIGGTSIKAGLLTDDGELLDVARVPTHGVADQKVFEELLGKLADMCAKHGVAEGDVAGVGMDIPGPVDADGHVLFLPNINFDPEAGTKRLKEAYPNTKVVILNDANAAILGEIWRGSASGYKNVVLLALGTGVGGGIVVDGNLVNGAFGGGGEIGHITVKPDETRTCGCGRKGCLEQYASAKGVIQVYLDACERRGMEPVELRHATDTIALFDALVNGDPCASMAVDTMVDRLGFAMAQIGCVVDPEVFLVGGGVANGYNVFDRELRTAYERYALKSGLDAKILPCQLGNDAAMYGSAYLALSA